MDELGNNAVPDIAPVSAGDITARDVADAIWLVRAQGLDDQRAFRTESGDAASREPPGARQPEGLPSPAQDSFRRAEFEPSAGTDPAIESATRIASRGVVTFSAAESPARLDRAIPRALRPLKQVVPSAAGKELDEDATAARAVVDPRWLPVYSSADEPRWDVLLIVDNSESMRLWRATAREFAETLRRQNAFRNVHVRLLVARDGLPALRGPGNQAQARSIAEAIDPTLRRIVLVLTDGIADLWRTAAMMSALRRWGSVHPLALVQVLPWFMWHRVGLEVHRVRLRSRATGVPSTRLDWEPQVAAPGVFDGLEDAMPVPVVELDSAGLGAWVGLAAGGRADWTDLGALLVPAEPADLPPRYDRSAPPARLVADFRAAASPATTELATLLAAAPLALGLMTQIRDKLLPSSQLAHLSEFLGSSLVTPRTEESFDGVNFEFSLGVREELLACGRRVNTARVREIAHAYHGERFENIRQLGRPGLDEEESPVVQAHDVTPSTESYFATDLVAQEALSGMHMSGARASRNALRIPARTRDPVGHAERGATEHRPSPTGATNRNAGGHGVTTTADSKREAGKSTTRSPAIFGGVPPRNSNFTGREDLLTQLDERLEPGATAAVLPEALHGLGGVGKSALAIEYAYRYRAKFDMIWWIPAERTVQIVNSLVELGERLELGVGTAANVAVQPVLDALKGGGNRKIPPNWLLIFDNADNPEKVSEYLPTGGPGRILVTSRNSQWLSIARPLEVKVFEREESVQLLKRRGPDITDKDASRLAEALGDLPLAVAQAAAWRAETGMPANEYLELLKEKQLEMLDAPTTLDYPTSVAAAWNVSLAGLQERNPAALSILQTCAFFAPEPVPRTMFTNARHIDVTPDLKRALRDRLRFNEVIRDINRFALARVDHRSNSIEMHRLVQMVLINQMSENERETMRHAAHLILAANDPNAPDDSDFWSKYAELHTHVIKSNAIESEDQSVRDLAYNLVRFLYFWGEHERSAELSRQIYDIWVVRLGPDDLETLKVGRWLGFMLWMLGHYSQAAELNAGILEACQRTLGDNHEDTVEAVGAVAADNRARGDFATALELSRVNYERCVRAFGDEDPVTLNAAHNLGVSLRLAGKFAEAQQLDEDTWDRKVQMFGRDHALTLITEIGLTIDMREMGDYRGAAVRHEDIVATYRRLYEDVNPALLRAVRQLSAMRRKAGDHDRALLASEEAVNGLTTRYGDNHADTLAAALGKSIDLRHLGKISIAMQVGTETLKRYQRSLGPDHPHTLSAAVNVAVLHRLLGNHAAAQELNQETLATFRARLGDEHPSTLVTAINLASDLYALGEFQAAHDLDATTASQTIAALGADHPTTLTCQANLAQDLRAIGRVEEGDRLRANALQALRARLGDHPAVTQLEDLATRANCDIDPMPL
ncbi:FxSxx-COOH system tetratricopeptide repeat protein [Lentzea kentuckyensis]|uniref:FxSxx-COOH system tetratricopeptide repeat protein n=1 Tax=Lentzea kentuckyensis TaxID=360086 RepID=UPI002481FFA9|nr:FxSxx-COOH system tetratricopeptide repeat protein [Lentzea kentuckyensis]